MLSEIQKMPVIGLIFGVALGLLLELFLPQILSKETLINFKTREALMIPLSGSTNGSMYAVGVLIPMIFGSVGLFLGRWANKQKKQ